MSKLGAKSPDFAQRGDVFSNHFSAILIEPIFKKNYIMNTAILNYYKIEFQFLTNVNEPIVKQTQITDIGYCLTIFLGEHPYVNYLNSEIISEINNAISNIFINNLERGEEVVLKIGNPNSTFTYTGASTHHVSIPTVDLKEIILSWIEFLTINGIIK